MGDLISRQTAIDAFLTELTKRERKNLLHTWSTVEVKYFVADMLEHLPSAQPERKTGKWISTDDGWDGEYFVCSVCGCPWTLIEGSPEDNGMNFCPNCGADMKGAKQDETD